MAVYFFTSSSSRKHTIFMQKKQPTEWPNNVQFFHLILSNAFLQWWITVKVEVFSFLPIVLKQAEKVKRILWEWNFVRNTQNQHDCTHFGFHRKRKKFCKIKMRHVKSRAL